MHETALAFSRRAFLQNTGALILAFSAGGAGKVMAQASAQVQAAAGDPKPPLLPTELDSWLAIGDDGAVTVYFGKIDGGQGTDVAIAQMVAEELEISVSRVSVIMGDTALTIDQGGASGSRGVRYGGVALRNAAAEARLILVERAAGRWGVAPEQLTVTDGVVSQPGDAQRRIGYAELLGEGYFHEQIGWNGIYGNFLALSGRATLKSPDQYRIVGTSVPRADVQGKVFGTAAFVTDIRVPGMLHGRMIRPPNAGTVPVAVDGSSIAAIPGARVVHKGNFLGIVAQKEWDAVRAAQFLKVTWSEPRDVFPEMDAIYHHIRAAPVTRREVTSEKGSVEAAFANAARVVEAQYEWPFQSHASMGGACAVADVRPDGVSCWTGTQKPHAVARGVAAILGVPLERVHSKWVFCPGSYGRNDAGDAMMDAAVLSQEVGRPVRVQYMRHEGTGWDAKGPASVHHMRAAIDTNGKMTAWEFFSKGFSRIDTHLDEADPKDTLAGQLLGFTGERGINFRSPENAYEFENELVGWETVSTLLTGASPLRTTHLRDPVGPQVQFASESFIDEVAAALQVDPVVFRLRHIRAPRDRAVIEAAAARARWRTGPAGTQPKRDGEVMRGQGIAYAQRDGTCVAVIADVDVNKRTGRVWVRRVTVAHDCGLIVNPATLMTVIEGNVVQGISRTLYEEVRFDRRSVTSVDWQSYPILEMADAPEAIDIELINRPEIAPTGAGEPTTRVVPAAINNAVFEATGIRFRRAPLTPERIRGAFA